MPKPKKNSVATNDDAPRACLFGEVTDGEMQLNDAGCMIQLVWNEIPAFYPDVETDGFVAMPNHVHGIIVLVGAAPVAAPIVSSMAARIRGRHGGLPLRFGSKR